MSSTRTWGPADLLSNFRSDAWIPTHWNDEEAIPRGDFVPLRQNGGFLAYVRRAARASFLVVVNLGDAEETFGSDEIALRGAVVIATERARDGEPVNGPLHVARKSALVIRLD